MASKRRFRLHNAVFPCFYRLENAQKAEILLSALKEPAFCSRSLKSPIFLSLESQWGAADFNDKRCAVPSVSYALGVFQVFFIKAAFIFLNLLKVKRKCVIIVVRIKIRTAERGKENVVCRLRRKSAIFFRGVLKPRAFFPF